MVRDSLNSSSNDLYSYSSEPRPIKSKYRNTSSLPLNLMNDKRVARGNTHSLFLQKQQQQYEQEQNQNIKNKKKKKKKKNIYLTNADNELIEARKPLLETKRSKSDLKNKTRMGLSGTMIVNDDEDDIIIVKPKRGVFEFQSTKSFQPELNLSQYLEENKEDIIEKNIQTQTDTFNERPPSPEYVPKKIGIDASTQIEPEDNLFDFDLEVIPLLEVLVNKTLDQSLEEVEQEEELKTIRIATEEFEEEKQNEIYEINQLEKKSHQLWKKKEKKLKEQLKKRNLQHNLQKKIACIQFSKQIIPLSLKQLYNKREKDPKWDGKDLDLKNDLNNIFLPYIYNKVEKEINEYKNTENIINDLIKHMYQRRIDLDNEIKEGKRLRKIKEEEEKKEQERLRLLKEEEERLKRLKDSMIEEEEGYVRVLIPKGTLDVTEDTYIGPLRITNQDTVMDVESSIYDWILKNDIIATEKLPAQGLKLSNHGNLLDRSRILMNEGIEEDSVIEIST